jgi:hypothetical protein
MMESAEDGRCHDVTKPVDRARKRRVLSQSEMRPDMVVQQGLRTPTRLAFASFCIDGIRGLAFAFASMGRSPSLVVLFSVAR